MTQELHLLEVIGDIDDKYLRFANGACPAGTAARPAWIKWALIAACITLLLAGCVGVMSIYIPPKESPAPFEPFVSYHLGTIARLEYEGRTYSYYTNASTRVLTVGDKLGEGMLTMPYHVSTSHDGTETSMTETQATMVYAVKGMDPSFMISTAYGNVFICDNDITLSKGADIFETRLHLREHYVRLEHHGWENGESLTLLVDPSYHGEFEQFLAALCRGQCVSLDEVTQRNGKRLIVTLDNGLQVHLILYKGGYVVFSGLEVAVKMETDAFAAFYDQLKSWEGSPWKTVTYPDWDAIKAEMDKKKPTLPSLP